MQCRPIRGAPLRTATRSAGRLATLLATLLLMLGLMAGCGPGADAPSGPGATTYLHYCYSCHAAGIAGAPRTGAQHHWESRAAQGLPVLLQHTIDGVSPGMPPRGGCRDCSDAELQAAIEHMLTESGLTKDGKVADLTEEPGP